MGGESASTTNPDKGRADKRKKNMQTVWNTRQPKIKMRKHVEPNEP